MVERSTPRAKTLTRSPCTFIDEHLLLTGVVGLRFGSCRFCGRHARTQLRVRPHTHASHAPPHAHDTSGTCPPGNAGGAGRFASRGRPWSCLAARTSLFGSCELRLLQPRAVRIRWMSQRQMSCRNAKKKMEYRFRNELLNAGCGVELGRFLEKSEGFIDVALYAIINGELAYQHTPAQSEMKREEGRLEACRGCTHPQEIGARASGIFHLLLCCNPCVLEFPCSSRTAVCSIAEDGGTTATYGFPLPFLC